MERARPGRKPIGAAHNAPSTQAREAIADALRVEVRRWRVTQAAAAKRLGLHRTALNRLLNGDLSRFALGNLVDIAAIAGIDVRITVHDPLDATLVHYNQPVVEPALFAWSPGDRSKQLYAARRVGEREHVD